MTDAVVSAALEELAAVGYRGLSMEAVARRAGASKATLYRRWSTKRDMVLEALASISRPAPPSPSTVDPAALVDEILESAVTWLRDPIVRRVLPDLLGEGLRDPDMGRALTVQIGEPRRAAVEHVLRAAQDDGRVRGDANLDLVIDLMAAPIFWRVSGLRTEVDAAYLRDLGALLASYLTEN